MSVAEENSARSFLSRRVNRMGQRVVALGQSGDSIVEIKKIILKQRKTETDSESHP